MNITLKQGEDKLIEYPVIDSNGAIVDLSSATEIRAELLINNQLACKYSLVPALGYGTISLSADPAKTHIIQVQVKRADSKNFSLGLLKIAAVIVLPDDLMGSITSEYNEQIGIVVEGYTKDEVLG